jgi:tetraacyldisaccharide 4'-kinase
MQHWWRSTPSLLSWALMPLALVYGALRWLHVRSSVPAAPLPVPVIVVGNFVVGGAGKTPTVIALVQALQRAGRCPGVISRGHGRLATQVQGVEPGDEASVVGDEPLLIRRRTACPVWVGRDRVAAARALLERHPDVDVIVSDDGLQHRRLPRLVEWVVFDERGAGNGLLLPAGPLRQPLPSRLNASTRVLYSNGVASTALPGALAVRLLGRAWPLASWRASAAGGDVPLDQLQGRPLLAAAGLAAPDKFFAMLRAAGLDIRPLPLPDHHAYATLPWPAATAEVVTTEKDAVKLDPARLGSTTVWVVPLDLRIPDDLVASLLASLPAVRAAAARP